MAAAVKVGLRDGLDHERRLREMPAKRSIGHLTEDERTEQLGPLTQGITAVRLLTRAEAQRLALACRQSPEGHAVWSVRLLAGPLVA